jgi:hypothetical protein
LCFWKRKETIFLADSKKITVFAVSQSNLPPNAQILLGIEHLKDLKISVDFAMLRPSCQLSEAMAFGKLSLSRCDSPLLDRNSGLKESYGCRSDCLSFSTILAMTSVLLLFLGLCSLLKEPNWSGPALSLLASELNPIHLFLKSVLLVCSFLFAAKGLELSRLCLSHRGPCARSLATGQCLPPLDCQSHLERMHANNFASVFAPQPPHLRREGSCAWGERRSPFNSRKEYCSIGRYEPGPLRPDRLGGFGRASRFGKFRTQGSPRKPLSALPLRGRRYVRSPPELRFGGGAKTVALRRGPSGPTRTHLIEANESEPSAPSQTLAPLSKLNGPCPRLPNLEGFLSRNDPEPTPTHCRHHSPLAPLKGE